MTFPPGPMPAIPADPVKGTMNWDTPLNAKLDALASASASAWQNSIDTATALGVRGITPTVNAASEIANPVDGQLTYVQATRSYLRYDAVQVAWVPFLTAGANGQFINTFRGAWSAQPYAAGSIVTSAGSSWLATAAVVGTQVPGTDSAWTQVTASGAPGTAGNTILNGTTNPTSGQGSNGDFYLNTATNVLWGPKASGAWPSSGTSIVGPTGATGAGVPTAGTTGQYLKKNSSTNFDDVWGAVVDGDISGLASVTNKALDSAVVHNTGAETVAGVKTFSASPVVPTNAFPQTAIQGLAASLAAYLPLAGGTLSGPVTSAGGSTSAVASNVQVTGDGNPRFQQLSGGSMFWGTGSATADVNLRRSAAGVVATDNNLAAVQGIQVGAATTSFGGGVGVLGIANAATAPTTNPSAGGVLYANSGAPTWRDPSGNVWSLVPTYAQVPGDQNLIAWTVAPTDAVGQISCTAGVIQLVKVVLRSAATITNIIANVATAGATLTASQCFAGIYDFAGTRQGVTADQSTVWNSTGVKTMALTTPYAASAGNYWIALVANGTTVPQFSGVTSTPAMVAGLVNAGVTASTARFATTGTAQTTLASTITPASNTLAANVFSLALS